MSGTNYWLDQANRLPNWISSKAVTRIHFRGCWGHRRRKESLVGGAPWRVRSTSFESVGMANFYISLPQTVNQLTQRHWTSMCYGLQRTNHLGHSLKLFVHQSGIDARKYSNRVIQSSNSLQATPDNFFLFTLILKIPTTN